MMAMHSHRNLPPPHALSLNQRRKISRDMLITTPETPKWPSDDPTYLSPPMTNSPTSPNRTQFPDQSLPASTAPAQGIVLPGPLPIPVTTGGYPTTTSMTSQVYQTPRPLQIQQYPYSPGFPPFQQAFQPHYYNRPDLQPRLRAQSIGQLNPGPMFQPSYPVPAPLTAMQPQYPAYHPPSVSSVAGPVTIPPHNAPRLSRTAPRRGKVHVAKACQNCKKAHLSCDDARPCTRCVTTRKEATCIDVEHKKRGRPRIQADRLQQQARIPMGSVERPYHEQPPALTPIGRESGYTYQPHSSPYTSRSTDRRPSLPIAGVERGYGAGLSLPPPPHSAGPDVTSFRLPGRIDQELYVAYLSMELNLLNVTGPLRRIVGGPQDLSSLSLLDVVDARHYAEIRSLQTQLREERQRTDPNLLPPLSDASHAAVQTLDERDVDRVTDSFRERESQWLFHFPAGRSEQFTITISLAKTTTFFIALVLQRPPGVTQPYPAIRNQPSDTAAPVSTHPLFPPDTRPAKFGAPGGPSSPYHRPSEPGSPFSTLPQALSTSLPPIQTGYPASSPSREQQYGGYFGRQPAPTTDSSRATMQPPPQPPTLPRAASVRETRRPAPLSNLNLPPLRQHSAPSTPNNPEASFETNRYNSLNDPPGSSSSAAHEPGSSRSQRRRSVDRAEDVEDEASRKRRRLDIGDLIKE